MQRSTAVGATSGINIQDANLLKIETTWGVELRMPFISQIISLIGKQISPIASFDYYLYSRGMIPVTSTTVVRMQSEAWENSSMVSIKKLDTERTQNGPEEQLVTHSGSWGSNGNSGGYDGSLASSYVSGFNPNSHWDNSSGNDDVGNNFDESNGSDSGSDEDAGDEDADPDPEGPDTGPACDTNWDDEKYQKQELECDGWFCENIGQQFQEFKEDLRVALNIVGDFIAGVYQGMVNQVEDLVELFSDPTVLIDIAKAFIDDPVGTLEGIVDSVVEDAETVMKCGPYDIGRILGENMNPAVALKVVTKLSKISGNAKLAKYADELEQDIACASFPAGTQIWTPDGPVAIETLSVGDAVLSRSTHNFQTHPQTVTHQLNRTAEGYQQITTEFGTLTVTPEHPFWVQGRGWTEAKNLQPEDPIATEEGDTLILENRAIEKPVKVYNLSVENTPSYFAGESKAWVHNATCSIQYETSTGKNKTLNNPEPNTVYYVDGRHKFTTDAQGRTVNVESTINENDLSTGIRNCYQQRKAGSCGLPEDDGGHMVATQLGGPGEIINLVPQHFNLNRGAWKAMENDWAKAAAEGKTVEVEIDIIYDGNSQRPSKFIVFEDIDGVTNTREFKNQTGG